MPTPARFAVLLALSFVPTLTSVGGAAGYADGGLHVSVDGKGTVIVPVVIGNEGPFGFVLDTGSTRSAVSAALAGRLGVPAFASTRLVTPAGLAARPLVKLTGLKVGDVELPETAAMIFPDAALRARGRIDGLLGQDVLGSLSYTIDYRHGRLVWQGEQPTGAGAAHIPVALEHGLFFVTVTIGNRERKLLADSGASAMVLFEVDELSLGAASRMDTAVVRTSAGITVGRQLLIESVRIGTLTLQNVPAVGVGRPGLDERLGDGLLPLHLFSRVTVDGPGRVLSAAVR